MGICCAERAYATLAPYYDEFTRHHPHDAKKAIGACGRAQVCQLSGLSAAGPKVVSSAAGA
jgi:hypothetical protein